MLEKRLLKRRMKKIHYIAYVICPTLTVLFSLIIGFVTMYLENTIPPLFVFLSVQFYLNWYLVYNINKKAIIPFTMATCRESEGGCILRQNMGNFILVCFYASFACFYSIFIVGPYLYDYYIQLDTTKLNIYYFALNFFFPITLTKYLVIGDESINVFLVTLFNVSVSIACFTLLYGLWKLYTCLSGRQRYHPDDGKRQDVYEIFGSYGLFNVIFPFNGFLHSRNIDENAHIFT
ncbi:PREDICTED: palmitoyltransferase ZDHHC22-like isoform X2 [Ceratosolen solmsi marchali]|uniref:Palmitoyltransferase ZDHHC22-like isoform X2 n=1 Tax=Ceratosolen solmsi marchali TaxID=326594 RepID=A0AAJ6YVM7_9HYME|nr:PREDICTED: palmitoyltransferase ZDHHC22-like isoform X2 [Ceratosolen solmsi marchali]